MALAYDRQGDGAGRGLDRFGNDCFVRRWGLSPFGSDVYFRRGADTDWWRSDGMAGAPRVTLKTDANLETLLNLAWPPPAIRQQDKALIGAALAVLRLDG